MTAPLAEGDDNVAARHTRRTVQGPAVRILLLDRSRLLADALGRRLLLEDDVLSVSVASSVIEALRHLAEQSFAVVVATPELAQELCAARQLRTDMRTAPIVVLAPGDDTQRAPDLFRAGGIAGWVSRDRSTDDLMKAIRACQRGDVCVPLGILSLLAENRASDEAPRSDRDRTFALLTEREGQVLLLLEQGMDRAEIACALHLSPNTVRTHIQRILRRLDVHSTLAALARIRV